jgi:hypothetical protein
VLSLYYNEDYKNNKKEVYTITSIATRKVTIVEKLVTQIDARKSRWFSLR